MQEKTEKYSIFFERISNIMDFYKIKSVKSFACDWLGYDSSEKINRLKKIGSNPSFEILNDISIKFDKINPEWLLTGNGSMLKSETKNNIKVHRIHTPPYNEKKHDSIVVPLYNIDAAANLRTIFDNKQQNIIDTIRIPDLPKCDGAIYIRGDSMYPLLKSGDIVIYKEISDFDSLIFGEMYLIDFTINNDDFLVVKFVKKSSIEGYIQLVSYNIHHDPIDIPVQGCIRAMALIKASVRINTMM